MNRLASKIKPGKGFAHAFYIALNVLLPLLVYMFVRLELTAVAIVLVLLGKWRIMAVKPRYWVAHVRTNAVDLFVGLSVIVFLSHTDSQMWQLIWSALYGFWLVYVKPKSTPMWISIQAMIGQLAALMALFMAYGDKDIWLLVLGGWGVCYMAARHFFTAFDEPYARMLALVWGYIAAAMIWVLGHWLLYYGVIAQPVVLLTVIGYGLATLYYLDHFDRLSTLVRRQFIFIMIAIIIIVLTFSDWEDKIL